MTARRQRLEEFRDQVLRDMVELDRQVDAGEVPAETAERLRSEYEAAVAEALEALESLNDSMERRGDSAPRAKAAHRIVYVAAGLAAVLAAGVFLPRFVADRPENGFVSGNEVNQSQPAPAPPRDLSTVTEDEMESVIARNPRVVGMRLALAERYLEQGRHDKAAEHYGVALKQQPGNPEVLAESGRLLLAQGKPVEAAEFVARAQRIAPSLPEAQILHAEILANRDASGARKVIEPLSRSADPDLRRRAEDLLERLDQQSGGGR